MKKYNLYDSLEMLDFIKNDHNIDAVKKFQFNGEEGFAAIFDLRYDSKDSYTLKKGVIKNQMICYREVECFNDEIFATYKIIYGNINETYEVVITEKEDLENVYKVVKGHLYNSDNFIKEEDFEIINSEIVNTVTGNVSNSKMSKNKVYKKVK